MRLQSNQGLFFCMGKHYCLFLMIKTRIKLDVHQASNDLSNDLSNVPYHGLQINHSPAVTCYIIHLQIWVFLLMMVVLSLSSLKQGLACRMSHGLTSVGSLWLDSQIYLPFYQNDILLSVKEKKKKKTAKIVLFCHPYLM